MSLISKEIAGLFNNNSSFQLILQATKNHDADDGNSNIDLVTYLNPVHPYYIHIVEKNESSYLRSLSLTEQNNLIERLTKKHASHIVFTDKKDIPVQFIRQRKITIVVYTDKIKSAYLYLLEATENTPVKKTSIHGSMVVIYGQGILITGESGSGKSTLLLSLLDRGHLWIADDAPDIYRNHIGRIIVEHTKYLSEFIHIKDVGPINIDKTFGKAKRIPRHTLAAIIHLGNNAVTQMSESSFFTDCKMTSILGKTIPEWCIPREQENRALLVESIARELILISWGENSSNALIEAHDTAITAQQNEI